MAYYLSPGLIVHYEFVVHSGAPAGGQWPAPSKPFGWEPPTPGVGRVQGMAVKVSNVVCRTSLAGTVGESSAGGASFEVSPGQSVALLSQPRGGTELFDVIAGLSRPPAGQVWVDGVAVYRPGGADLDRYRARRGLVSLRFPLLPSLSVIDNVLAAPPDGRATTPTVERAMRLLELTGATRITSPVHRLSAEEQWRVMIARALVTSPRLLLAEDPAPGLDSRAADWVLDVLMDAHAMFGFTLVLTADRPATAVRCQRRVLVADDTVAEDEITSGDDAWTRSRIDRIG
jgi:putative ABC transport system ATP-binding protein